MTRLGVRRHNNQALRVSSCPSKSNETKKKTAGNKQAWMRGNKNPINSFWTLLFFKKIFNSKISFKFT